MSTTPMPLLALTAAQRARGLDTEGSIWRRVRGLVPIVAPVILGSIAEVEERTMALEARAFTRPGRRTLLWAPHDTGPEAAARWFLVAGLAAAWRYTPLAHFVAPERIIDWAHAIGETRWAPLAVMAAYTPAAFVMFPRPLITLFTSVPFSAMPASYLSSI